MSAKARSPWAWWPRSTNRSSEAAAALRGSEPVREESAIHCQHLAGDVTGGWQAQEGDRGGDLLGLADASQRRAVEYLVQVIRVGQRGLRALGADVPGCDRVDADAVHRPLRRQVAGELVQRRLAHAVGRAGA